MRVVLIWAKSRLPSRVTCVSGAEPRQYSSAGTGTGRKPAQSGLLAAMASKIRTHRIEHIGAF